MSRAARGSRDSKGGAPRHSGSPAQEDSTPHTRGGWWCSVEPRATRLCGLEALLPLPLHTSCPLAWSLPSPARRAAGRMALDSFPPRLASTRCQALTPCSHPTAAAPEQAVALLTPFWSLVLFSASCLLQTTVR